MQYMRPWEWIWLFTLPSCLCRQLSRHRQLASHFFERGRSPFGRTGHVLPRTARGCRPARTTTVAVQIRAHSSRLTDRFRAARVTDSPCILAIGAQDFGFTSVIVSFFAYRWPSINSFEVLGALRTVLSHVVLKNMNEEVSCGAVMHLSVGGSESCH